MAHDLDDEGRRILGETTDPRLRYPRLADAKLARARLEARRATMRCLPPSLSLSYLFAPSKHPLFSS